MVAYDLYTEPAGKLQSKVITTDTEKIAVMNVIYPVITNIAQELRQTVERLTVGGSGLVLVSVGWLLTRQKIELSHRLYMTICIPLFCVIAVVVTKSLERRYRGVAQVIRNINEAQLAHEVGAYLQGKPLFPTQWKTFGSQNWKEPIFQISYWAWFCVGVVSLFAIWLL